MIGHVMGLIITIVTLLWLDIIKTCNSETPAYIYNECGNCTVGVHKTEGTIVDCSSKNFYRVPRCRGVNNVKQLLLSSNSIYSVPKDAFEDMNSLEVISLDDNNIQFIHSKSFCNLFDLKELYLGDNGLNQRSFSENVFNDLKNLQILHMCGNQLQDNEEFRVEKAISALTNLQSLHIPGFEDLEFDQIFQNFSSLKELRICDQNLIYSRKIFQGFKKNTIEYLNIRAALLHNDSFTNFKHLKGLTVSGQDTILKILDSLWPFVKRTFEYLRLGNNVSRNLSPVITIIPKHFKYLGQICTSELDLSYNNILHIQHSALIAFTSRSCIKKLDVSGNLLHTPSLFALPLLRNLEYLNMCCMLKVFSGRSGDKSSIAIRKDIQYKKRGENRPSDIVFFVPPSLKFVNFSHTIKYTTTSDISVIGGENITGIDVSFSKLKCSFWGKDFQICL